MSVLGDKSLAASDLLDEFNDYEVLTKGRLRGCLAVPSYLCLSIPVKQKVGGRLYGGRSVRLGSCLYCLDAEVAACRLGRRKDPSVADTPFGEVLV